MTIRRLQTGVSLIEVVIAMVLISLAAGYALPNMQLTGRALLTNEQVQTAAQYAQACAEHILQLRRDEKNYGYATIASTSCSALPVLTDYTLLVTITTVTNATDAACAPTVQCKRVKINGQYQGATKASVDMMLAAYQ